MRALLTNLPQEIPDDRAEEDEAEFPEAEAYANVGASTSLPDLAVGAAANVGAFTSLPVLDVVAATTTSLAIGLGQITSTTLGSRPQSEMRRSLEEDLTPFASEFPLTTMPPWHPGPHLRLRRLRHHRPIGILHIGPYRY